MSDHSYGSHNSHYSDDDLITILENYQVRAVDYANTALQEIRYQAWQRYLVRERGDEVPGRSRVLDTSIRDTVHALCATIIPTYDCTHLIDFPPTGEDDVDNADAEAKALNDIFRTGDNMNQLAAAIKDALLFRNGILKVYLEDKVEVETRKFAAPIGEVLAGLEMAGYMDVEEVSGDDELTHVKITTKTQRLRVRAIEPAYFYIDPNQDQASTRGHPFMSERFISSRSELVELGVSRETAYELPASPDDGITSNYSVSNTDITAKFIDGQSSIQTNVNTDQEKVECFWTYAQIDMDDDGISEKWRFLLSNRRILLRSPVSQFPYSSGSGWPVNHRWSGLGVYDLLIQTENQLTGARRQLQDNLSIANNQRPIFDPATTNVDDIMTTAPGRGIRSKDPMSVAWMPVNDITTQSMAFIQQMHRVRSEQTGASLDLQSVEAQGLKTISGLSAEVQLGPAEQMAAEVSRNLANTLIKDAFLKMHRVLREEYVGKLTYRRAGEWVETSPSEWKPRSRINITVALSPGERRRHAANLQSVMQLQQTITTMGGMGVAVDLDGIHKAATDWMRAAQLDDSEEYLIDPQSQKGQQGQQQSSESQQQQQQMQAQMAEMQQQLEQFKAETDRMRVMFDKQDDDFDNETDRLKLGQDAEIEEAKLTVQLIGNSEPGQGAEGSNGSSQSGNKAA